MISSKKITHSIIFFPKYEKIIIIKWFLSYRCGFAFIFPCFCLRLITACFVADLLRGVVVSSTVSFFVGFHVDISDDKIRFKRVIISNHICQYANFR